MDDIWLANNNNPGDWLDLSIGEPKSLANILSKIYKIECNNFIDKKLWEYQRPNGYPELVAELERRHGAKVVITNGAKQALAASLYALKKHGASNVGMRLPFWTLIPPLAEHTGLEVKHASPGDDLTGIDSYMLVAPNNPDGYCLYDNNFEKECKAKGIPLVHDGAYYTEVYVPGARPIKGDMQIFSISKMYGLSGLRIGYIVCHDKKYYNDLTWYMETFTVGVSTVSQCILLDILKRENEMPELKKLFEEKAQNELSACKNALLQLNQSVIDVPDNIVNVKGMFAWVRVLRPDIVDKAKVKLIDGKLFGCPGMARMNLGVGFETINEMVRRINSHMRFI